MTTSNIYEAAFYLTGTGNFLEEIEVKSYGVCYHISGSGIGAMKKRYQSTSPKVSYHSFVSWYEKLQELTNNEKNTLKGADHE